MRILLIDPCKYESSATKRRGVTRFPQVSLLYIKACTPPSHEVTIVEEEIQPIDYDAPCDLVGITCMTASAPRAYDVADTFRRRGRKVVLGGVHPTVRPEEASRHADAVVVGEAEPVWAGLLADAEAGRLQRIYKSTPDWNLDSYPLPARQSVAREGIMSAMRRSAMGVVPIVTSRGCPYACEFCCVRNVFGRTVRHVAIPRVLRDIEGSGGRNFMFLDDNIVGDPVYAEQLFDALRGTGIRWVGQASVSFVRNERLLEKAAASGCKGLFIGLESVTERKMARMQKSMKTREATAAAVRRIMSSGILFHASIVFGFDDDDPSVFDTTLEFLHESRISSATFNILTPYPGTVVYDQLKAEDRLLTEDWRDYDHCTPTFVPRGMSLEQLQEGYQRVKERFYGLPSIALRMPANWRTPLIYLLANVSMRAGVKGDREGFSLASAALSATGGGSV